MEQIGTLSQNGLTPELLERVHAKFPDNSELIELKQDDDQERAVLLVIRNGVNALLDGQYEELYQEQQELKPDTKKFMYGEVRNSQARHNLCFSGEGHEADLENGKGTVIAFKDVPLTAKLKKVLEELFETDQLQCEGNYYYDTSKCYIGYHGDKERRTVIGARLGSSLPLEYCWFHRWAPIGDPIRVVLNGGDIYAMSEKAVGFDWKRPSIPTLRHSAGLEKYLDKQLADIKKELAKRQKKKSGQKKTAVKKKSSLDYEEEIS
jgi:hypothetical protein